MERYKKEFILDRCEQMKNADDFYEYKEARETAHAYALALYDNNVIDTEEYDILEHYIWKTSEIYWKRTKEKVTEAHKMLFGSEIK